MWQAHRGASSPPDLKQVCALLIPFARSDSRCLVLEQVHTLPCDAQRQQHLQCRLACRPADGSRVGSAGVCARLWGGEAVHGGFCRGADYGGLTRVRQCATWATQIARRCADIHTGHTRVLTRTGFLHTTGLLPQEAGRLWSRIAAEGKRFSKNVVWQSCRAR